MTCCEDGSCEITTTVLVTFRQLADTLVSALEGGSTYWCEDLTVDDYKGLEWAHEAIAAGTSFEILTEEGTVAVAANRVHGAVTKMATDYPRHFGDMVGDTGDAETGDILFQLICFGEVVYG